MQQNPFTVGEILADFHEFIVATRPDLDVRRVMKAADYAATAHDGQRRRYTNEHYIVHPVEVAKYVAAVGLDETTVNAALNHDVLEDTDLTFEAMASALGRGIALTVDHLTDTKIQAPRKIRNSMNNSRLAVAPPNAKSIKIADGMSNVKSIVDHDIKFARVYVPEKRSQLDILASGNEQLFRAALHLVESSAIRINMAQAA